SKGSEGSEGSEGSGPRDQIVQRPCNRPRGLIPVMRMPTRAEAELGADLAVAGVETRGGGAVTVAGPAVRAIVRAPEIAADVIAPAVRVDPFLDAQAVRVGHGGGSSGIAHEIVRRPCGHRVDLTMRGPAIQARKALAVELAQRAAHREKRDRQLRGP